MKKKLSILLLSSLPMIMLSCKKEENKIYYEGGTPPALGASTTTVSLEPGQEANTAIVLNWTNPDYKFTTGLSSQDVTYALEMDTLGANFSSSKKYTTGVSKDLSKTLTVGELNSILGNDMLLQLNPRRNYTLQLRIISSIGSSVKLTSNIISFTTKPFAPPPKVTPPASGNLYIVGDATPANWPASPVVQDYSAQKFTQISSTDYQLTIALTGPTPPSKGEYKLVEIPGQWVQQWSIKAEPLSGDDPLTKNYDLYLNGANAMAPSGSATYKIEVDFQSGKVTLR